MSFQHGNAIGRNQNQNMDKKLASAIGQDIWPRLDIDIYSKAGNFVYNYKLKKYEHMNNTPVYYEFKDMQEIKRNLWKNVLS